MSTRLKESQVAGFISTTLLNIQSGVDAALTSSGLVVELPEKADFNMEVIIDGATMTQRTATSDTESGTESGSNSSSSSGSNSSSESTSGGGTSTHTRTTTGSTGSTRVWTQLST